MGECPYFSPVPNERVHLCFVRVRISGPLNLCVVDSPRTKFYNH